MEIIVFIVIIAYFILRNKNKISVNNKNSAPDIKEEREALKKKFTTDKGAMSRLSLYEKVLIRDHYNTVSSVSKELHLPPAQVVKDIRELQQNGYIKDVCLDSSNTHISYHHSPTHPTTQYSKKDTESTRIHVKGKMGLNADYLESRNGNMNIVRCSYCGAENAIPYGKSDYHCYFCWEQLR